MNTLQRFGSMQKGGVAPKCQAPAQALKYHSQGRGTDLDFVHIGGEMKVFIACESSGVGRRAFAAAGHEVISNDLQEPDDLMSSVKAGMWDDLYQFVWSDGGRHIVGDCFEILAIVKDAGWVPDLLIAHPTCTYLTNAGVRHLHSVPSRNGVLPKVHGEARWQAMREGAEFFNRFKGLADRVVIENPVPHRYAREIIGQYDQLVQPWHFGHEETKATCLWLENLPPLVHTNVVGPPPKDKELRKGWAKCHMTSPGPDRWKTRSKSYSGILQAMVEQWGNLGGATYDNVRGEARA